MNVYRSVAHNSQKLKILKMSVHDEGINKMWYIHKMEYYSAVKRDGILIDDITWTNPENML